MITIATFLLIRSVIMYQLACHSHTEPLPHMGSVCIAEHRDLEKSEVKTEFVCFQHFSYVFISFQVECWSCI